MSRERRRRGGCVRGKEERRREGEMRRENVLLFRERKRVIGRGCVRLQVRGGKR